MRVYFPGVSKCLSFLFVERKIIPYSPHYFQFLNDSISGMVFILCIFLFEDIFDTIFLI